MRLRRADMATFRQRAPPNHLPRPRPPVHSLPHTNNFVTHSPHLSSLRSCHSHLAASTEQDRHPSGRINHVLIIPYSDRGRDGCHRLGHCPPTSRTKTTGSPHRSQQRPLTKSIAQHTHDPAACLLCKPGVLYRLWLISLRCVVGAELSQELDGAHFSVADVMKEAELEKAVKEAAEKVSPHAHLRCNACYTRNFN